MKKYSPLIISIALTGCIQVDEPEIKFSNLFIMFGIFGLFIGFLSIYIAIREKFFGDGLNDREKSEILTFLVMFGWMPLLFIITVLHYIAWSASWNWKPHHIEHVYEE